jgi:chitinase
MKMDSCFKTKGMFVEIVTITVLFFTLFLPGATSGAQGSPCIPITWSTGVDYPLGTIVEYPSNGNCYKEYETGTDGSDATDPTISTWYWSPTICNATPNVVGAYWPNWVSSPIRIINVPPQYNLIYLFSAQPVGGSPGTGSVFFTPPADGRGAATNFNADIQYARTVQGRKVILSIGGAGNEMSFPDRTTSQTFVNSIVALYNQFGGFDGIDWDTYEGSDNPDTSEMIWISLQLKQLYPGFLITSPPAPWSSTDVTFCTAMVQAGALDYCAPQYYDGPDLADPSYVVSNAPQWVSALGPTHVVIGFGVDNAANYMTPAQAADTWNQLAITYPTLGGAFDWNASTDETQGWPFADTVAPLAACSN